MTDIANLIYFGMGCKSYFGHFDLVNLLDHVDIDQDSSQLLILQFFK